MNLEICVDSYSSLLTAIESGADRIELCSALNLGGLTPSYGLMKQAQRIKDIQIVIMIRPRSGDFIYDEYEYDTMKKDIDSAKELGFDGIVVGTLLSDGKIDMRRIEEIVRIAHPLSVTLHRAFDDAKNPEVVIPDLIKMGIERILTSGQRETAIEGKEYILKIQKLYGDEITIMPGSGINEDNIYNLYKKTGCTDYHMSGKKSMESKMEYRESIKRMNTPLSEFMIDKADFNKIKRVREILDTL